MHDNIIKQAKCINGKTADGEAAGNDKPDEKTVKKRPAAIKNPENPQDQDIIGTAADGEAADNDKAAGSGEADGKTGEQTDGETVGELSCFRSSCFGRCSGHVCRGSVTDVFRVSCRCSGHFRVPVVIWTMFGAWSCSGRRVSGRVSVDVRCMFAVRVFGRVSVRMPT